MERTPPSTAKPGLRLDQYELLCPIAQGGMAVVWLARAGQVDGRLVIIKMLLPQYAMDEQFQQMFVDEANISSGIAHPNVARILDGGEDHGIPYLVMEYIDGESIARLTEGVKKAGIRFPPEIALRLIADAAAGLHAAHELRDRHGVLLNVVHRDVSPQNVLVRNVGTAAVIDFGIAKARDRLAEETRAGNLKGKVRYMAPEQALGKPVDRRVDVWALGAMLFEIFAGKGPYEGGSEIAALQRLVKGQKPSELPNTVPEPVRRVVAQALAPNRDERLPTAAALEEAIVEAIVELGEAAPAHRIAAFTAPFMKDRSAARYAAAREAMVQLDTRAGIPARSLQATASGGYVAVTPEMADEATQINVQYDLNALEEEQGAGFRPAAGTFPPFGAPTDPPFGRTPMDPGYSSVPPSSNIAQSISEVLSGGIPRSTGPTGTLPPAGAANPEGSAPFGAVPFLQPQGPFPGYAPPRPSAPSHPSFVGDRPSLPSGPNASQGPATTNAGPPPRRGLKLFLAVVGLLLVIAAVLTALQLTGKVHLLGKH